MNFGKTITQLRAKAGLSQQEVAEKIGIARATYAGLEVGRRDPNLSEIQSLAEFHQLSPSDLINGVFDVEKPTSVTLSRDSIDIAPRDIVEEDPNKLREVLLYILEKVGAKPNVGETVIYKLLYFIDFDYYEKFGKSITGLTYIRNHFGPTPAPSSFAGVIDAMELADEIEIVETPYFSYKQKKYLPTKKANLEKLNAQELQHINEELARLSDKSATELSDLSHKDIPWLASAENQQIDYQLAMYRTSDTSVKEPGDEL